MFRFSGKAVHILSHYMAHEDLRYYLNGIYAEPAPGGGAFLVATDGHQMGVFYDAEAICSESLIFHPNKAAVAALKPGRGVVGRLVEINAVTQRLTVLGKPATYYRRGNKSGMSYTGPTDEIYIQPGKCFVEGKFPDWKRVLKPFIEGSSASSVTVNAAYLAKFHAAVKAHCNSSYGGTGVSLFFKSDKDAILLNNGFIPEFQVLLMPMRDLQSTRMNPAVLDVLKAYVTTEAATAQGGV